MTAPIVFCDTETTSLNPWTGEIWEVALLFEEPRAYHPIRLVPETGQWRPSPEPETVTEIVWQLPVDLANADPMSLAVGQYHQRRLPLDQLTHVGVFADEFAELTLGLHLVGACITFDDRRLADLLHRAHQVPGWHYHAVDVEALVAGFLRGVFYADSAGYYAEKGAVYAELPWNSGALSRAVGVDPAHFDRHTALGDCRWAQAMWHAVFDGKSFDPIELIGDMS